MKTIAAIGAAALIAAATIAQAQRVTSPVATPDPRPVVVVLHSYHFGFTWSDNISAGVRSAFAESGRRVELRFEFLDARRYSDDAYFEEVRGLLERKYADVRVGVVICSDDRALEFMLSRGEALFRDVPLVFCSVSGFDPEVRRNLEITGLIESIDISATIETALRLHPDTTEVVVIADATHTGRALKSKAEPVFRKHRESVDFRYLDDLTVEELEEQTAALGDGSLIFLFLFSRDQAGRVFSHEENLRRIRRRCAVPIYAVWEFYLGHGIVGGKLTAGREEGRMVAEMAGRILDGERASDIPLDTSPTRFAFDWRELERFGIDLQRLPPGSHVVERPQSLYREHRELFWALSTGIAMLVVLVIVLATNALRRRKLEARQARFAAILASTTDFVATSTPRGQITYLNPAGRRLIGWKEDETLADKQVRDVQPKWVLRLIRDEAGPISVGEGVWAGETAVVHRDGTEIPVSQVILSHRSKRGELEFMSTIIRDLRPRIEAEEALRASEEVLRQSQKMEAIGQLAGGVAHDFNNLLTGIMGNADLLSRWLDEDSRERRRSLEILRASEKAASLTRQMLTLSRKGELKREIVDLSETVEEVITLLMRSIDRRIRIERGCHAERTKVLGDPAQLENAVLNLAVNARDAMPDGGTMSFDLHTVKIVESDAQAQSNEVLPGEFVELTVRDTGIGIPDSLVKKIFEPFFTTKGPGEGTGLGLATVYGCIRNHKGTIGVVSTLGSGTSFRVLLPVAGPEIERRRAIAETPPPPKGSGRILVVDDEEIVGDLVCECLEELGYSVSVCRDGQEAIDFYRRNGREIDVVILDMIMPRVNGPDAFRALMNIDPEVRVLLSSGFTAGSETQSLLEEGALGFLAKPYNVRELAEELARVMG